MLEVEIGKVQLRNPVLTASGTFGFGKEYEDFIQMDSLGGMVVKGITGEHREGNAYPRMAETASGMLNAVGLQNPGVDRFCREIYPQVKEYPTAVIVNVSGSSIEEYIKVASAINELDKIPAIELNISCPNVKEGGMAFGIDPIMAEKVVKSVRKVYSKTLLVKLSPNVTNITEIARAAEAAGADALCCINTLLGMAIDAEKQRPILSTITGGLSGPAIKPIALRMVWQTSKAVGIPIVGIGGIMNATDVIEFMLAGATAVQVGTANFVNPALTMDIVEGLRSYCERKGIKQIREIIGMI